MVSSSRIVERARDSLTVDFSISSASSTFGDEELHLDPEEPRRAAVGEVDDERLERDDAALFVLGRRGLGFGFGFGRRCACAFCDHQNAAPPAMARTITTLPPMIRSFLLLRFGAGIAAVVSLTVAD